MATEKRRLDQLLVERHLADSRVKAQALILAGRVQVAGARIDKAGTQIRIDAEVEVQAPPHPWVSRGGIKLAHALESFALDPTDVVALDVGASTGGFTDVLLQNGAARVYAVDVGHGQLDWRLRDDDRVVVMERTNARHLTVEQLAEPIDWVVCDASFIGLRTILPAPMRLVRAGGLLVALIKPQFEVGPQRLGKGGVVRDAALREEVCEEIAGWMNAQPGWSVRNVIESPIKGPKGNVEYLLHAVCEPKDV